jgi:hypothetical protein
VDHFHLKRGQEEMETLQEELEVCILSYDTPPPPSRDLLRISRQQCGRYMYVAAVYLGNQTYEERARLFNGEGSLG